MYAVSSHEAREVKTETPEGTNRRIDYIGSGRNRCAPTGLLC